VSDAPAAAATASDPTPETDAIIVLGYD